MKDIRKRIEELEQIYNPDPLIVLCETEYGKEELTVSECIRRGAVFLRVVTGRDANDLEALLLYMRKSAIEFY